MNELKLKVNDIINNINQIWVLSIKEAYKTKGELDIGQIMGKYSEQVNKLNQEFIAFEQRHKRKGLW
jgi:hypothetical protein